MLFEESLLAIHIFPSLAGAATLVFVCLITRELGGGLFATGVAALGFIIAPVWLILDSFFCYDSIDQLVLADTRRRSWTPNAALITLPLMEYRHVGKTGLKVSELCLGAMTFGREATEADSHAMLDRYAAAGGNFIDTANVYSAGRSEEVVGRWLARQRRESFVIATKVRFAMGTGPNDVGLTRKHIYAAVQDSLKRLGTDYIDLYQVHAWDPVTPLEETLGALNELVARGWVRYIGASNFRGWQLQKALDISRARNWHPFVCLQPQYNLMCRATEFEILPVCRSEGLGVIPWSPLRGGWLSGRYRRGMKNPVEGSRVAVAEKQGWSESWARYNNEATWKTIDELLAVSQEAGKTPAQTALRWLLQNPVVTAPILGAHSMDQLSDNLGCVGWQLSDEHMRRLDAASALPVSYPYDDAAETQQRAGRLEKAARS